uniref:Protein EARLY FLOWERING 3 n=1 Tax=Anthurium amnicola TaxID=1678845 RepID=A0A1D1Y5S9_9ARAE
MKRGREGDKVLGPLFPRLHVNDANKGGPRAPPRNKMALYEQLSIPSHRFNSGSASARPLPPHNGSSLVPSVPASQGHGHERSVFSRFYEPSRVPAHAMEKVNNHSAEGLNPNAMRIGLEKKSAKHVFQTTANTAGSEQAAAECSSSRLHGLSNAKESSGKELEDEDDFMVPTFVQPGVTQFSDKDHRLMEGEIASFHSDSLKKNVTTTIKAPIGNHNSDGKPLEQHNTAVLTSQQEERDSGKGKPKNPIMQIMRTENMLHPATREAVKRSNITKSSSNPAFLSGKPNELDISHHGSASLHHEGSCTFGEPRHLNGAEVMEMQDILKGRGGSCSKMSFDNSFRGSCVTENGYAAREEDKAAGIGKDADKNGSLGSGDELSGDVTKCGSLGDANRNDDASETSMVDSISGVDISPDDVVGVIGPKHFWKARRAIVNQQRVFAMQIFELHRLIKVQKLIAESPHLLLEGNSYLCGLPPKSPVKNAPVNSFTNAQEHIGKEKDETCKVNTSNEFCKENMVGPGNASLPSEDSNSGGSVGQFQGNGPCSGNLSSTPATSDSKQGSWCFHLQGNQWLIPVMSPTEGLIYKPYSGPCPPTAAFTAPVYGGCSALSVPPGTGDFMGPAYGVPTSHRQQNRGFLPGAAAVAPNFFPAPYSLPVVNPLVSRSAVEQVSSLAAPLPGRQNEEQSQYWYNISNPENEAVSECARKAQIAEDCDLRGRMASNPCDRVPQGRDVLSLIPMASATECLGRPSQAHFKNHQSRVIKVVPHNPRSATESAARIFRSIQKERQQYDSV